MTFNKLDNLVLTQVRTSRMLEELLADTKTEIETKVSDKWVHDANDSVH